MKKEFLNELSEKIIGAAIEVHRELGPGLLESAYEAALLHELKSRDLSAVGQVSLPIWYKDLKIEQSYRLDLVVEDAVIIEIKTVESLLPSHSAQLLTYLKMSKKQLGLLINFNSVGLVDGVKRQVHQFPS